MLAFDLADAPLPKREWLRVWIVDAKDAYALSIQKSKMLFSSSHKSFQSDDSKSNG